MKHTESIAKLAMALVAAQRELKAITKDATNPHFRNKYASLDGIVETVRPTLAKHGLAVVQGATSPITDSDGSLCGFAVETMLIHDSGEWLCNAAIMPLVKVDAQGAGGAMTYGRRYGLSALLSLATDDDDDGHTASQRMARPAAPAKQPTPSAPIDERAPLDEPSSQPEPSCPKCQGKMFDNRAENDERAARGEKLRPDWKCRSRTCDGVIWRPKQTGTAPRRATVPDDEEWVPPDDRELPF